MSEQDQGIYHIPSHTNNGDSIEIDNEKFEKLENQSINSSEKTVEIDFHKASGNVIPYKEFVELKARRNEVNNAYSHVSDKNELLDPLDKLLETMDPSDRDNYYPIKEIGAFIDSERKKIIGISFGIPKHIQLLQNKKPVKSKKAA